MRLISSPPGTSPGGAILRLSIFPGKQAAVTSLSSPVLPVGNHEWGAAYPLPFPTGEVSVFRGRKVAPRHLHTWRGST
jgi:hypothetical protein